MASQNLSGFDSSSSQFSGSDDDIDDQDSPLHHPFTLEEASTLIFGDGWDEAIEGFDFDEIVTDMMVDEANDYQHEDIMQLADMIPEFFCDEVEFAQPTQFRSTAEPRRARASTSVSRDADDYVKYAKIADAFRIVLDTSDGLIYAITEDTGYIIGRRNTGDKTLEINVLPRDYLKLASLYNEEVKFKGAGLGFSVFLHSVACVSLCASLRDSVLEPPAYGDVASTQGIFEITGRNWQTRQTKADFVIDKYALTSLIAEGATYDELYRLSRMEDDGDASMFDSYPISQPDSPYTMHVKRMMLLTQQMQKSHNQFLSDCVKYWISNKRWILDSNDKVKWEIVVNLADSLANNFVGYDLNTGQKAPKRAPCPFRALPATLPYRVTKEEMMNVRIFPGLYKEFSTYKVMPADYDPEPLLLEKRKNIIICPETTDICYSAFAGMAMQFASMQSTYAESLLMTKIIGKNGTYFDESCQLGIAWAKKEHSAVNGHACFFLPGRPDRVDLVGKWSTYQLDELLDTKDVDILKLKADCISVSPAFSFNNNDVHYSSVLFGKIITTMVTAASQVEPLKRAETAKKIILLSSTWKASSWMTTSLASECRFFTLTEMAGSGDPASMVLSCMTKLSELPNNKISFPTYYYFTKLRYYANNPRVGISQKTTPLWQLPGNLLSLEKDIVLGMQWKTRLNDDKAKCTSKLLKGITLEYESRDEVLNHLMLQNDLLSKLLDGEATKEDFMIVMATSPRIPHYNHPFFCGLTYDIGKALEESAGRRKEATEVRLHNLITDNNCWTRTPAGTVRHAKMADCIKKLLLRLDNPDSIYEAIVRTKDWDKVENTYFIHPKGGKQSRREIAQMNEEMRLFQYMQEMLASVYTDAEPVDMMRDKQKFSKVINDVSRITKKKGFTRSEDRSFFCGYMHPEFMSVALYQLARITHSTALVCSASILRQDRSRWIVLPHDHSGVTIPSCAVQKAIIVESGKKLHNCTMLLVYEHFMQGMRAVTGAAINSAYNDGMNSVLSTIFPQISDSMAATTSDDVIRGYVVEETVKTDISRYLYAIPSQCCVEVMMLDSVTKPMEMMGGGEFNNVAMTARGAVTQSPIHACLAIQPLTSPSIMGDVISAVSQARATLFWGDTPDLAQSALETYKLVLSARWLLPRDFFDIMGECGLWPQNLEQLIGGFAPRTNEGFNVLWAAVPESKHDVVLSGAEPLSSSIVSWRFKSNTEKKRVTDCTMDKGPYTTMRKLKQIKSSRHIKGKLNPTFIPQMPVKRRLEMTRGLMAAIQKARLNNIDQGTLLELKLQYASPVVTVHPTPMRAKFLMPIKMGEGYNKREQHSYNMISSLRHVGVSIGRHPTEEELNISRFVQEDYDKWVATTERRDSMCGLKFDSPMGLPLMMHHNNTMFKKGVLFNFTVSTANTPDVYKQSMYVGGKTYHDINPCEWGNNSIRSCKSKRWRLAYGFRRQDDKILIFIRHTHDYAVLTGELLPNNKIATAVYGGHTYAALVLPDFSPIRPQEHIVDYVPSGLMTYMTGTDTALLNYGKYLNTSNSTAFSIMQKIFSKLDSHLPNAVRGIFRSGALFASDAVVLPKAEYAEIIGDKYIGRLRLERTGGEPLRRAIYDVQVDPPVLKTEQDDSDNEY